MEQKKNITVQDLIESHKKSIKFISVNINGVEFKVPINYSMAVSEEYQEKYQATNDYKEAFYAMTQKMIDNSRPLFDKENIIPNLSIDDIKKINDSDCCKIVDGVIEKSKSLKKHYTDVDEKDFYKKLNIAILNENKELKQLTKQRFSKSLGSVIGVSNKFKNMYKPPINSAMNNYLSIIDNIKNMNINSSYANMGRISTYTDTKDKGENLNLNEISLVNPEIETNTLLKDVTENLNRLHEIQKEQVKANEQIANILLEEQKSNEIKENKEKRNFIITMVINVIILVIAILSFIGFDRVHKWI